MAIQTMSSENARRGWGLLIEAALKGVTTIVNRHERPTVVVMGFTQYERLVGARVQRLNAISRRMDDGDFLTLEEVEDGVGN